jgi:hypothetical protein
MAMTTDEFLAHYGVKGMHWGIRRDPETGVRPIAKALDSSRFGRMANKNAERRMSKQRSSAWYKSRGLSKPKTSGLTKSNRQTNASLRAVATGRASVEDHIRASGSLSIASIIRNKGYRNAAQARLDFNIARNDRIRLGQASAADRLAQAGNMPLFNFGGSR